MSMQLRRREDGLVDCEFCGQFRGRTVTFDQLAGPLGVVHHLVDHDAAGDHLGAAVLDLFADLYYSDPFGEFNRKN